MPAHIKEFVIVNNTGNIFTGDNLSDTSFTASKSYSGSMGCTWIDVVTVIGTETKLCLQPEILSQQRIREVLLLVL